MRFDEKRYEFRKKLLTVHNPGVRNKSLMPESNEYEIREGVVIKLIDNTEVILTAAQDFVDYMLKSMGIAAMVTVNPFYSGVNTISVRLKKDGENLGNASGYMGSSITISYNGIEIVAFDERGAAQAFYYLEDVMNLRKAPFLTKGHVERKSKFSPRMVHSGYGIDDFPDAHLSQIAHTGMDAILVFVTDVNRTKHGFLDFNDLIYRAAKFGIDVYLYSYLRSKKHPEDEGAAEFYESTYGKIFKNSPGFKGVILVGESIEFPSKDPHTTGRIGVANSNQIPNGLVRPGSWPCYDYPQLVEMIKNTVRKYNPDADIVLWSYNWGKQPEKYRLELINNLPDDVTLLATFERPETVYADGVRTNLDDYTLSFEGPCEYFLSEAKAAKEKGIKLYAMANTAGLTWDFGVIPYEPFPYQWERRFNGLVNCHEEYGLCGIMESHHFGYYPSFVSEYAKWHFFDDTNKPKDVFKKILASRYGEENTDKVDEALKLWSESIRHYIVHISDQSGPCRIGPAYPLNYMRISVPQSVDFAHFGTRILNCIYDPHGMAKPNTASPSVSLKMSIDHFEIMEKLLFDGIKILETIENPNDELLELIDLGKFIKCNVHTILNCKYFCNEKAEMNLKTDSLSIKKHLDEMEKIARDEIENAKEAIPLVRKNSRLGWEPSMEYLGDEEYIKWKIEQVEYMIKVELGWCREDLSYNSDYEELI